MVRTARARGVWGVVSCRTWGARTIARSGYIAYWGRKRLNRQHKSRIPTGDVRITKQNKFSTVTRVRLTVYRDNLVGLMWCPSSAPHCTHAHSRVSVASDESEERVTAGPCPVVHDDGASFRAGALGTDERPRGEDVTPLDPGRKKKERPQRASNGAGPVSCGACGCDSVNVNVTRCGRVVPGRTHSSLHLSTLCPSANTITI